MDPAVAVVEAYLELCGYFVLTELPVRRRKRESYEDSTDLDIVAVRFPRVSGPALSRQAGALDLLLGEDERLGASETDVDVIIGEVKEGQARLNTAMLRVETIAFALRRVGCCPEELIVEQAREVAEHGQRRMSMPGRVPCTVRVLVFAGHGEPAEPGVQTIPLAHCFQLIEQRLQQLHGEFAGTHFKNGVLSIVALRQKVQESGHDRPSTLKSSRNGGKGGRR